MRIDRSNSNLSFRRRRKRGGCLSLTLLLGLLVAVLVTSWNWIGGRLGLNRTPQAGGETIAAGEAAFAAGDLNRAVELGRAAVNTDPNNPSAITLLARALIYRSYVDYHRALDRDSALQLTTSAAERSPSNAEILAIHAFVLQAAGDPVLAARTAERALQLQADHPLAITARALAYARVGSHDTAVTISQEAVRSAGDGVWALDAQRALAISLNDLGHYREALAAVDRAIAAAPRLIPLYFERALYARQIGNMDAATVAYFQVITLDENNAKARLRLCEVSSMLREPDAALRYCGAVTTIAPEWADGWHQLGREYFLQGNYAQAQRSLQRCAALQTAQDVPLNQRIFECWYLQGQAAEILGDCPALIAIYNDFRAMAAAANIPQTWVYPPEGPPMCQ